MLQSNFDEFLGTWYHRSKKSWKSGPYDSILHPKHTHTIWTQFL